jgi:alpha-galactosidase
MLGNDLRNMTPEILGLVSNQEILAVNQDTMGEQAWLADSSGDRQVWARSLADGSKAVALVNRTGQTQSISAGFDKIHLGSRAGQVRDRVAGAEEGLFADSFAAVVGPHDTVLVKVTPAGKVEAESGTLSGGARVQDCPNCSGGKNVGNVGNNAGQVSFNVTAPSAGGYDLRLFYNSGDTRSVMMSVNGGAPVTLSGLNSGGWSTVAAAGATVRLNAGNNALRFYNTAGAWAPDLDMLAFAPASGKYRLEAEAGTLSGGANVQDCSMCSGGKNVGHVGNNNGRVTLPANVLAAGTYKVTVYYNSDSNRRLRLTVNEMDGQWLDNLNSGSWSSLGSATTQVNLAAGANSLALGTPLSGVWGPDIDRVDLELITP